MNKKISFYHINKEKNTIKLYYKEKLIDTLSIETVVKEEKIFNFGSTNVPKFEELPDDGWIEQYIERNYNYDEVFEYDED